MIERILDGRQHTHGMSRRRALYLSHTGMTEPLGQSQVVPYVRGLVRAGWSIELVGFEPAAADEGAVARVTDELSRDGIRYLPARRSPSHAPLVKVLEAARALGR